MSSPETADPKKDNVPEDIRLIISATRVNGRVGVHREVELLEKLVMYIVNRDGKVMEHGMNIGLNSLAKIGKDQQ